MLRLVRSTVAKLSKCNYSARALPKPVESPNVLYSGVSFNTEGKIVSVDLFCRTLKLYSFFLCIMYIIMFKYFQFLKCVKILIYLPTKKFLILKKNVNTCWYLNISKLLKNIHASQ